MHGDADGSIELRMKPAWLWECPECNQKNMEFMAPVEFTDEDKRELQERYPEMTFQTGRFASKTDIVFCDCGFGVELTQDLPHPLLDDLDDSEKWKRGGDDD